MLQVVVDRIDMESVDGQSKVVGCCWKLEGGSWKTRLALDAISRGNPSRAHMISVSFASSRAFPFRQGPRETATSSSTAVAGFNIRSKL